MKTEEPRLVPTLEDEFASIKAALNAYREAIPVILNNGCLDVIRADGQCRFPASRRVALERGHCGCATRWHLRWAEDDLAQLQLMVETDLKYVRELRMAGARARLDNDDTTSEYEECRCLVHERLGMLSLRNWIEERSLCDDND